jgi:hypothetical protein
LSANAKLVYQLGGFSRLRLYLRTTPLVSEGGV